MWPLQTTARRAEFQWRWFLKSLWTRWGHFGVILGPFRANLWPRTQNCHRIVMWPIKTTTRGAEFWWRWFRKSLWWRWGHFRHFSTILGSFWGHLLPFEAPKWPERLEVESRNHHHLHSAHLRSFWVVIWLDCYKFEFRVKNGPEWSQNGPKMSLKLPKITSMVSMWLPKLPSSKLCSYCGRFDWSHD